MEDDNDLSIRTTIDSNSRKSGSTNSDFSESDIITIYDEHASLLRHSDTSNNINKKNNQKCLGLILMTLAILVFSIMSICVRISNKKNPYFQSVFTCSIFQVIGGYIGCKLIRINPWGHSDHYFLLTCHGICIAISMTLFFAGMGYLPLADNTAIFFSGPTITGIIAWFVLDEQLTKFDGLFSSISLLGVILISKPDFLFPSDEVIDYNSMYFLIPFFGACMGSFGYIIMRFIGNGIHYLVHIFYFGIVSTIISGFSLFIFHIQDPVMPNSGSDWMIYIIIAISAFIGHYLLNRGLQLCATGPGTLIRNLGVIFAFIFGIIILGEIPTWNSVLGALIIVGSSIFKCIKKFPPKKSETESSSITVAISIEEDEEDDIDDFDI